MVNSDLFKFYSYFCVHGGEKLCAHDDDVMCGKRHFIQIYVLRCCERFE